MNTNPKTFDILTSARKAGINPVVYAHKSDQISQIDWTLLADHELCFCDLSSANDDVRTKASDEIGVRVNSLIEAGLTFTAIIKSVFLPSLDSCGPASVSLKQRVREVSIQVILDGLNDQKTHQEAISLLSYHWTGKYGKEISAVRERMRRISREELKSAISAGSLELPKSFLPADQEQSDLWNKYVETKDLADTNIQTLISLLESNWWRIRALDELLKRTSIEFWFRNPMMSRYDYLGDSIKKSIMMKIHEKFTCFDQVRNFKSIFSFSILNKEEKEKLIEKAILLVEIEIDVQFLIENYGINNDRATAALLKIQRKLEAQGQEKV